MRDLLDRVVFVINEVNSKFQRDGIVTAIYTCQESETEELAQITTQAYSWLK